MSFDEFASCLRSLGLHALPRPKLRRIFLSSKVTAPHDIGAGSADQINFHDFLEALVRVKFALREQSLHVMLEAACARVVIPAQGESQDAFGDQHADTWDGPSSPQDVRELPS
jgi:hypothetical protein